MSNSTRTKSDLELAGNRGETRKVDVDSRRDDTRVYDRSPAIQLDSWQVTAL